MRILVTNHHLHEYTGTEVSTITLCKYLHKAGNTVTVYSKYFSKELKDDFLKNNIRVIDNLEYIKNEKFDIGHIQHNISAYEIRYIFPTLPLIMWVHGKTPFLEQPPFINLNISYFLGINKEVLEDLKQKGIDDKKIILFRNIVDPEIFKKGGNLNKKIKKALIISNKLPENKEDIIRNVLKELKIKFEFLGSKHKVVKNNLLPKYINDADIVFTLGLGAIESMFCGRIPILFDFNFSEFDDGIVLLKDFDCLKEFNFSGRCNKRIMTEKDLLDDITKYNYLEGDFLKKRAIENYSADQKITELIDIYKKTIKEFKYKKQTELEDEIIHNIYKIIQETKFYAKKNEYINVTGHPNKTITNLLRENEKLINNLNQIKDSKFYKLWPIYNKLKNKFIKVISIK